MSREIRISVEPDLKSVAMARVFSLLFLLLLCVTVTHEWSDVCASSGCLSSLLVGNTTDAGFKFKPWNLQAIFLEGIVNVFPTPVVMDGHPVNVLLAFRNWSCIGKTSLLVSSCPQIFYDHLSLLFPIVFATDQRKRCCPPWLETDFLVACWHQWVCPLGSECEWWQHWTILMVFHIASMNENWQSRHTIATCSWDFLLLIFLL